MSWGLVVVVAWAFASTATGCDKVPLQDINARFTLADAVWFESEATLFYFWRAEADQGLGESSQLELTWRTDDAFQPWTPVQELTAVHLHVPVDCGDKKRCGSISLDVPGIPREVGLRLRYHKEGAVILSPQTTALHVVHDGPAHVSRSLHIYGVFDETNRAVQWRSRHVFPNLRNEEVQELGLRRDFIVSEPRHGPAVPVDPANPYGYAAVNAFPRGFVALGWEPVATNERAVFHPQDLPLTASESSGLCAKTTVTDAKGTFEAYAFARKNPEVRAAFPALRSPIRENAQLGFVLRPCNRTISQVHLDMQVQRLLLAGAPTVCIDDWKQQGFIETLAARLRSAIDAARPAGQDMVLVIALHHDDRTAGLRTVIEEALVQVLPFEIAKSSPRATGAFILDSFGHTVKAPELKRTVLWCPADLPQQDLDEIPGASVQHCPLLPDQPDLTVGPFKFNQLPILPTRPQYEKFLEKYSEAQAGVMKKLTFRAPEQTPLTETLPVGEFGVVTFFNMERLTAEATDSFSFCPPEEQPLVQVVFRTEVVPDILTLDTLGEIHAQFPQERYQLGLLWDFPFLLRLEYETRVAGAASAYGFSVPFGIASQNEEYKGSEAWETGEFALDKRLLQCRRFCDFGTFDSGGVYNVNALFNVTYRALCYEPLYPKRNDGGFPRDP